MSSAPGHRGPTLRLLGTMVAAVLGGLGVWLGTAGWLQQAPVRFLTGTALALAAVALLLATGLPLRRSPRLLAAGAGTAVALGLVLGLGVVGPQQRVDAEYSGQQVQWRRTTAEPRQTTRIRLVLDDRALVLGEETAEMVSLSDGLTLGSLEVDRETSFSLAGEDVLLSDGHRRMLHDADLDPLWDRSVQAEAVLAHGEGLTVLTDCPTPACETFAVDRTGAEVWRMERHTRPSYRLRHGQALPLSYLRDEPDAVLPQLLAGELLDEEPGAERVFELVDLATGDPVAQLVGEYVGVARRTAVVVTEERTTCTVSTLEETTRELGAVPCRDAAGGVVGGLVLFGGDDGSGTDSVSGVLDTGAPTRRYEARPPLELALGIAPASLASGSAAGVTWANGDVVLGRYWAADRPWRIDTGRLPTATAGEESVTVVADLEQLNPFDQVREDDVQVTVHDLGSGEETGRVRLLDHPESIRPLGRGAALVSSGGELLLLGRPLG